MLVVVYGAYGSTACGAASSSDESSAIAGAAGMGALPNGMAGQLAGESGAGLGGQGAGAAGQAGVAGQMAIDVPGAGAPATGGVGGAGAGGAAGDMSAEACRGFSFEGLIYSPGGDVLPNICEPFHPTTNNPYAVRCVDAWPWYATRFPGDEFCILPPEPSKGIQYGVHPQGKEWFAQVSVGDMSGYENLSTEWLMSSGEEEQANYITGTEQPAFNYYRNYARMRGGSHHLVKERGPDKFRDEVEAEWAHLKDGPSTLTAEEVARVQARFTRPTYEKESGSEPDFADRGFSNWKKRNVQPHKVPGYAAVTLSLKKTGVPPGDVTSDQMEAIADLAERYSFGELRVSHEQNLVLADVRQRDLAALWREARALGLATPNIGLLTNIISCPGGDFCALANAKSIPVAQAIQEMVEQKRDSLDYLFDIGELDLNISGCMNACGHHHVGHIGILGVDKNGEEWYQIEIGGNQAPAAIGKVIGPAFARADVPDVIERLIQCYLERRDSDAERFVDVVHRIGIQPFKERVYGHPDQRAPRREREPVLA
jgi:dissimilatory sulfite reductase (desulfoviridin) alpha/beta subunit